MNLPGGPTGKWRNTWHVIQNPRRMFVRCVQQYGDPFVMRAINGDVLVTGRPDLVEQIFKADPDAFAVFASDAIRPILGSGSLLMMEGPPHRAERKRVAPPLHGDRMKAYGEAMQATATAAVSNYQDGREFTGLKLGTEISLDVILQTVLGADSHQLMKEFRATTRGVLDRSLPILFFSPRTQFSCLGFSPMDRLRVAQVKLRQQIKNEVQRRGESVHTREDILSILARPTDDEPNVDFEHLADSIGTLLFAGHETTAVTIAWTLYHLHWNPDWLATLRLELDQCDMLPETLAAMPMLRAITQETLRLNPIVTEVLRTLTRPMQIGDYHLPAGFSVAAAACLTHYDESIYESPETFNPGRFLNHTYSPSQYYPFGGGNRRCVGAAFASYEMAIVLGTLIRRHEFELLETTPVVPRRRNITMCPSTGVRLRVSGAL
ncbi:cytochrome P450 [Rubripirellula reticaptiva]|uniref:Cytochrome P450 n=1 Tax=Rubripirellula reticaptiva TaxID=2528013 RepID=A0A5C6FBN4_9BACT|nr:cytochrome P450 [Rubripirellula reticaptiva]TWU57990.1 hypothetical protein Poly59_08990 [Rubripirellula reticaptiva]